MFLVRLLRDKNLVIDGRGPINVGVPFSYTDTYDLGLSGSLAETFIAQFGSAIAATENKVIIGAPGRAVSGQYNKGAAFIYNHDGTGITTVTGGQFTGYFGIKRWCKY